METSNNIVDHEVVIRAQSGDSEASREIIERLERLSLHHRWGTAEARAWWRLNEDAIEARSTPRPV